MLFSEIFISLLVTTLAGCSLNLARLCYKSKCTSISCCGVTVKRDVVAEVVEHEFDRTHPNMIRVDSSTNTI